MIVLKRQRYNKLRYGSVSVKLAEIKTQGLSMLHTEWPKK